MRILLIAVFLLSLTGCGPHPKFKPRDLAIIVGDRYTGALFEIIRSGYDSDCIEGIGYAGYIVDTNKQEILCQEDLL